MIGSKMLKRNAAEIAAGTVMLLSKVFNKDYNLTKLSNDFDVESEAIKECSLNLFVDLIESKSSELKACRRKFGSDEYHNVGTFQIKMDN